MPLISVVIPSRNRPAMLREAVESVIAQTHREIEIIIVLTGADRETTLAARELEKRYPAIRVLETEPRNLAATRNAGLALASGEWVAFLDDDDLWLPTKLEKQMTKALESGAEFVNCDFIERGGRMDGIVRHIRPPSGLSLAEGFVIGNYGAASASGALVRINAIRAQGGFDEDMDGCEDWDCWRRLSWRGRPVFLDEPLVVISRHGLSMQAQRRFLSHIRHALKTIGDTPPHLRHMLKRLVLRTVAIAIYDVANYATLGKFGIFYRSLKSAIR